MSGDRNQTILAIDDSPLDLDILREILKTDYRFQAATSAESAMEIIASDRPPDLVLLDILMPEVDGIELCRMIKTSAPANRIPVIFVTAKDAVEDEALGFEAGGVDYIVKPVNPHLLKARVRTHLELKRQNEILRENARPSRGSRAHQQTRSEESAHGHHERTDPSQPPSQHHRRSESPAGDGPGCGTENARHDQSLHRSVPGWKRAPTRCTPCWSTR